MVVSPPEDEHVGFSTGFYEEDPNKHGDKKQIEVGFVSIVCQAVFCTSSRQSSHQQSYQCKKCLAVCCFDGGVMLLSLDRL